MELPNEMSRSLELSTQNTHDESNTSSEIEVHVFMNAQKFVNVYSMLQYGSSKNRVKAEV